MPETKHCHFYIERKNRFCKMLVKEGSDYCGEHVFTTVDNQDAAVTFARMVCPLDSSHTCYVQKLRKHLKKCNANKNNPSYIVQGLNRGTELNNSEADALTLADIDDSTLLRLINKINSVSANIILKISENELLHPAIQKEIELKENGSNFTKHLSQVSSLLSLMENFGAFQPNTCFIEFGAGRGLLTYWLGEVCDETSLSFLLVERAAYRHKFDGRLSRRRTCIVRRVKADIGDLCLQEIDLIQNHQHLVVVSKHLCGSATDMALRSITSSPEATSEKFDSIFIATCCHHCCDISSYVGTDYLLQQGFEPADFSVMCGITSWATCGNRKTELVPKNDNSTDRYAQLHLTQEKRKSIGKLCKIILDYGRIKYLEHHGYEGLLTYYVHETISPENICLIARRT